MSESIPRHRLFRWMFAATSVIVMIPTISFAQDVLVTGTIYDGSGNQTIRGATIQVVHEASGVTQRTVSDADGNYAFTRLRQGLYTITAELKGFFPADRRLEWLAGNKYVVNLQLFTPEQQARRPKDHLSALPATSSRRSGRRTVSRISREPGAEAGAAAETPIASRRAWTPQQARSSRREEPGTTSEINKATSWWTRCAAPFRINPGLWKNAWSISRTTTHQPSGSTSTPKPSVC